MNAIFRSVAVLILACAVASGAYAAPKSATARAAPAPAARAAAPVVGPAAEPVVEIVEGIDAETCRSLPQYCPSGPSARPTRVVLESAAAVRCDPDEPCVAARSALPAGAPTAGAQMRQISFRGLPLASAASQGDCPISPVAAPTRAAPLAAQGLQVAEAATGSADLQPIAQEGPAPTASAAADRPLQAGPATAFLRPDALQPQLARDALSLAQAGPAPVAAALPVSALPVSARTGLRDNTAAVLAMPPEAAASPGSNRVTHGVAQLAHFALRPFHSLQVLVANLMSKADPRRDAYRAGGGERRTLT